MSRIGKQKLEIPKGVSVMLEPILAKGGVMATVKGPLGAVSKFFKNEVKIIREGDVLSFEPISKSIANRALWGTYASHIQNMLEGVTKGFSKRLTIEGIGYKADVVGGKLTMSLGFSHPVKIDIPSTLKVTVEKGVVVISGADKEGVGQYAASVIAKKPPEPYKGKGILHEGQVIRRKQGKKTVA